MLHGLLWGGRGCHCVIDTVKHDFCVLWHDLLCCWETWSMCQFYPHIFGSQVNACVEQPFSQGTTGFHVACLHKVFPSYCYQTLGRETSISLPIDSGNCSGLLKFWLYFKILFAFQKKRSRSICFIEFCCGNGFTPKCNSQRHSLCLHCSLCSCLCACHYVWENINSTQFSFPYGNFLCVCKHVCNSFSFYPYPILHTIC